MGTSVDSYYRASRDFPLRKQKWLADLKGKLKEYPHFIITDYRGLSVKDIGDLRSKLYEKGVVYQVVKNNLLRIALESHELKGLDEYLTGPCAIAFSKEDLISSSSILTSFAKGKKPGMVQVGFSEGSVLDEKSVLSFSRLGSKEALRAKFIGLLRSSQTKFLRLLQSPPRQFLSLLEQKKLEQKN